MFQSLLRKTSALCICVSVVILLVFQISANAKDLAVPHVRFVTAELSSDEKLVAMENLERFAPLYREFIWRKVMLSAKARANDLQQESVRTNHHIFR